MSKALKELQKYVDSKEHKYQCIGYSEGMECCLEKDWIKNLIKKLEGEKDEQFNADEDEFYRAYNR